MALLGGLTSSAQSSPEFRFAIIGDRTITIGDWIEGGHDATAEREWLELEPVRRTAKIPTYFVAGNHDIWNRASRLLFERFTGRPARYSFNHGGAHFVVLDNANSLQLAEEELAFLEKDLAAHPGPGAKFVLFHRPDWIFKAMLGQNDFRLHRIALRYGVTAIFSGHTHMYKRLVLDGVTYMMVCSAGGSIRARDPQAGGFAEGFFYGYTQVTVRGGQVEMVTQELGEPFGKRRRVPAAK